MRGDEQVCHVAAALSSRLFDVNAGHKDRDTESERMSPFINPHVNHHHCPRPRPPTVSWLGFIHNSICQ